MILLVVDCLRPDLLGYFSNQEYNTPNIDNLARNGVAFTNAIATGPTTSLSYPSILTSKYPFFYTNKLSQIQGRLGISIDKRGITIAELLKRNGYSTAAFHSNPYLSKFFGYNRGFDIFSDINVIENNIYRRLRKMLPNNNKNLNELMFYVQQIETSYNLLKSKVPYCRAEQINSMIKKVLENLKNKFFLWVHYMDCHQPYMPHKYDSSLINKINAISINAKVTLMRNFDLLRHDNKSIMDLKMLYKKEVEYVDKQIGYLIDTLEKYGFWPEESYIILTADHGEEFMEHGGVSHNKGKLYEELLHVPLILAGSDLPQGIKINLPISLLDISPTIAELARVPYFNLFNGKSLLPLINKKQAIFSRPIISEGIFNDKRIFSCRKQKWKYIMKFNQSHIVEELYDLIEDPLEKYDISRKYKEKAKELKKYIINHIIHEEILRERFKKLEI